MNITTTEAKERFAAILDQAANEKERVVVMDGDKPLAAIVPMEDMEALEALDDARDVAEAEAILDEMERTGERPLSWKDAKLKHGI